MTIERFCKVNRVNIKLVKKWIDKGLIPEADRDMDYIPDSARVPYTKARAKNADSIYISMVKGAFSRKHLLPILYGGMCQAEFDGYIERLVDAGLLQKRLTDNVMYYDATIQASQINKKFILQAIEAFSRGLATGASTALMNRVGV